MRIVRLRVRGVTSSILCLVLATALVGPPIASVGAADFVPTTTRVSVSESGVQANGISHASAISADGRYVAFTSSANNLSGAGQPFGDAYVKDLQTGAIESVNVSSEGVPGNSYVYPGMAISADGRYVAFASNANNLVDGDAVDDMYGIYVRARVGGTTELVSTSSSGTKADNQALYPSISADGRWVAFESYSTNLVAGDDNSSNDIFVHDRDTGETECVSVSSAGVLADLGGLDSAISANGRYVTFRSYATNLVDGDTNGWSDVFVHDRDLGVTERVSLSSGGAQGDWDSGPAVISGDGRYVAFNSVAENLVADDDNGASDMFVHDRDTGETERVSVSSTGVQANGRSENRPAISADGRFVAFQSEATNLVPEKTQANFDILMRDRETSETVWISVPTNPSGTVDGTSEPAISADGSRVTFTGFGTNIVPGDTNGTGDVFLREWFSTNEAPVSVADAFETAEDAPLVVAAPGVLANDTDADGDGLTAIKVTGPAHGTLSLAANGSFTYTPVADYNGSDSFQYRANDGTADSNVVAVTLTVTPVDDPEPLPPIIPIEGATRFDTAVAASKEAYPDGLDPLGARTAVIATGRNWPDALGGSSLAGALGGPILLVDTNSVPAAVAAEITRLGADRAIILGGTAAVGASVEAALKTQLGNADVTRIAGTNRYETAGKIAARVIAEQGSGYDGTAFVATGGKFPDALGAAPLAAANVWPLYLANPATGLSAGTKTAMAGVTDVVILGGTGVVSPAVGSYLEATYPGKVTRLAGGDRYETAVKVATYGVDHAGLGWNRVAIATGENFPDALAGGVLQGKVGSVMMLTRPASLNTYTKAALTAHKADITTVTFFGGTGAIPNVVRDQVANALE